MQLSMNYDCCKEDMKERQEFKTLADAQVGQEYKVRKIESQDDEMITFLFTLGCYAGEKIALISVLADNYVINIKNARYSIDSDLAKAIKL